MKKGLLKKVIAVVLSLVMVCGLPASVIASTTEAVPVVYVADITESSLYNTTTGESVLNMNDASFLSPAAHILFGILMYGMDEGDEGSGLSLINKGMNAMFGNILCDEQGNSIADNVDSWYYDQPLSYYAENADEPIYTETLAALVNYSNGKVDADRVYVFTYDWRLDPMIAAEELSEYIEYVKAQTGSSKVRVLAGGYGGIIANAYLYYHAEHAAASVLSLVILNSDLLGNSIMGDIMKGELYQTIFEQASFSDMYAVITSSYRGDAFENYLSQDPTGFINSIFATILGDSNYTSAVVFGFLMILKMVLAEAGLGATIGESYNMFLTSQGEDIYEAGLREYMRNMPGLWALVPEDDYSDAIAFMFGDEFINARLDDKINEYRTVMASTEQTLRLAQDNGINVYIVANYGVQILPITATCDELSDGLSSVKYASAGATTTDKNDYAISTQENCTIENHTHISPDADINAATCILPENTWFVKGLPHFKFTSQTAAEFLVWLLASEVQQTVWVDEKYPQYLKYNSITGSVVAYSDNTVTGELGSLIKGDVNRDGEINAADARLTLRYAVGLEGTPTKVVLSVADVVGNDGINAADARMILRYAVGLETSL